MYTFKSRSKKSVLARITNDDFDVESESRSFYQETDAGQTRGGAEMSCVRDGYSAEMVKLWDRVALKGLGKGRLPGGGSKLTKCLQPAVEDLAGSMDMSSRHLSPAPLPSADILEFLKLSASEKREKAISSGRYGTVYEINDQWVIKMPEVGIHFEDVDESKIQREAVIFQKVYGPQTAIASGEMLLMRKVPGDRADLLETQLNERQIEDIKRKINDELTRLDNIGINHGDPNWGNFLVDSDGHVWAIDFGESSLCPAEIQSS
ncbi:AarF/UbiB family protein [Serratia sp. Z4]|uniref:AarF/UbiB family protein n=1 Tax=Serratia sp. Z4 TaxID=2738127 RepID=UPI001356EE4C|nr:AarF/UbiB family protein [Serratia sp. Z4]